MQQFDYVLLAYGSALLMFSSVAYLTVWRDRKLRRLIDTVEKREILSD